MTRKDYNDLAVNLKAINDTLQESDVTAEAAFRMAVGVMMHAMERENGRFDRGRFVAAVGL
jgi:hypothetical protein